LKLVTLAIDGIGNCIVIVSQRIVSARTKVKSVTTSVLMTKELRVVIVKLTDFEVSPVISPVD